MSATAAPTLEGEALRAVKHRGSHMQIIAAAGSGKTEVVSQRVVDLLADGNPATSIVAFTFTERAASELKHRIGVRVEERLGRTALDGLNGLFVGTIHAYCFRLLQQRLPRYETFDVLDDNQLTGFLSREARRLDIKQLDDRGRLFASIELFRRSIDVIENELLDVAAMPEPFRSIAADYYDTLDRYRLLTYGQQIVRTVEELERPEFAALVHADLRHLIVDEYQDVNPSQERLVQLLAGPQVEICVVGDDDQAIYQWRGSDVSNIVEFGNRYDSVATFTLDVNRRSRPQIIDTANRVAQTITPRLAKTMKTFRPPSAGAEIVLWHGENEPDEASWIANLVLDLADQGVPYRDMAVLVRSRAAYPALVDQFAAFAIPVQPGDRSGLFDQREARVLGRTFAWLSDIDWRDQYGPGATVELNGLLDEYELAFELSSTSKAQLTRFLREWKDYIPKDRPANLVGEYYDLLSQLDVRSWDIADPIRLNRLGTLARFTALLADYETVRRRARPDADVPGEQVGGQDRGKWFYGNLALHIINHAQGAYDGFDGEPDFVLDAVDLTTVHRAKGLEWPAVFVPSLTARRFPSTYTGRAQQWLVPRDQFAAARYEGSDADERRLFYVAITRGRDWVSVSRHARVKSQGARPSPYYVELSDLEHDPGTITVPTVGTVATDEEAITLTYSELDAFLDCGFAFRLRNRIGFQPRLAPELGYGKAVHHVMRTVAERTRSTGVVPTTAEIDDILDNNFFLPAANKPAHRNLKEAAKRLVTTYATKHEADLHRIWETERPFELHLEGITVVGRADVILDREDGVETGLAIVDYKTSTGGDANEYALQLQIYSDAGRREGLDVRAAYVHDLKAASRDPVSVDSTAITAAESLVADAAVRLRNRDFTPNPGQRCRSCEVRTICSSAT